MFILQTHLYQNALLVSLTHLHPHQCPFQLRQTKRQSLALEHHRAEHVSAAADEVHPVAVAAGVKSQQRLDGPSSSIQTQMRGHRGSEARIPLEVPHDVPLYP